MERDLVITGVIFIVVGAIVFFMGQSMSHSYPYYQSAPMVYMIGIILLIVGFIVSLVGGLTPEKEKKVSDDVKCEICGIPRGDQHFYVVNDKDRKLIVCGQCVEPFRKEIAMKNKTIEQPSEALNILKTRYAQGEITKEQFEQMKKDLEK
jgi:hypothetical protein